MKDYWNLNRNNYSLLSCKIENYCEKKLILNFTGWIDNNL